MKIPTFNWRQRLITTSLLCLVLPSILTLALTGLQTKNEFKKKAILKSEQSLEVADLYISNILHDMLTALNTIQYDSELITSLRTAWSAYSEDSARSIDLFSFKQITKKLETITTFGTHTYVTILLPDELYFTNYSTYSLDISFLYEETWIEQMANDPINTTFWLGTEKNFILTDKNRYPNVITVARAFKLFQNVNAYIIVSKPEEQFHQIFERYEPDQIMMLQDDTGKIVSQTDANLIGQSLPPSYTKNEDTMVNWNDAEYLSTEYPMRFAGWRMQSLTAAKGVTGNVNYFINVTFLLQILFFVIFSFIMLYLLRQLTNPIMKISRTARKVEDGNLDVRSKISGDDDIGRLGLSFDRMLDRVKEMVLQIEWEQDRKRIVELELLQAQINPHFLFNTLNSIRLQVMMKGEQEIANIIESLSTLLRMTINRNNEFLPLHEEVGTVEHYMKLMNFRHSDVVQLTINLASDTLLVNIPRFTIQPLIENAYIHGLNQQRGEIQISSKIKNYSLYLTVQDNGKGMTEQEMIDVMDRLNRKSKREATQTYQKQISGIGLQNVNERLRIIYGNDYDLHIESTEGLGVTIIMKIPINRHDEGGNNHV